MADYIDRKKVLDEIFEYYKIPFDWDGQITEEAEETISIIENAPSVDAVEVVRCKDCKYRGKIRPHYCHNLQKFVDDDDFCKWGELDD